MTRSSDHQDVRTWLGLPADADDEQVEGIRDRMEEYLADAPPELAPWARGQISGRTAYSSTATGTLNSPARKRRRSPLVPIAAAAAVVVIGVGVYQMGESGTPADAAGQTTATTSADGTSAGGTDGAGGMGTHPQQTAELDEELVASLSTRIEENPEDTAAMRELANEYSRTAHFRKAAETQEQILAVEPDNLDAKLAYGVAHFNMDDLETAEQTWKEVLEQDPENVHAYYDLGFLYFAQSPPDIDAAEEMWTKVVELEPESDVAQTVSTHLERFREGAAEGVGD